MGRSAFSTLMCRGSDGWGWRGICRVGAMAGMGLAAAARPAAGRVKPAASAALKRAAHQLRGRLAYLFRLC